MDSISVANERVSDLIGAKEPLFKYGSTPYRLKKIVDGKKYDTETADEIAAFDCNSDFGSETYRNFGETLYQTPSGAFFLVGEGLSQYTPWCAPIPGTNEYGRGHALVPLSSEETKTWLEIRGLVDEYEEIFGQIEEAPVADGRDVVVHLNAQLLFQIHQRLSETSQSLADFLEYAISKEFSSVEISHE